MILDKPFSLDDFVNNTSDVQHICSLVDKSNSQNTIRPRRAEQ